MNYTLQLELQGYNSEEIERFKEIFKALIQSGGLLGVKGGQTILHFNQTGQFVGVQLSYWPYRVKEEKHLSTT